MGGILSPWGLLRRKLCNKTQHSARSASLFLYRKMDLDAPDGADEVGKYRVERLPAPTERSPHLFPPAGLQTARAGVSRQPLPSDFPGP